MYIGVMGWLGSTHLRDDEIVTVVKEITSLISYILGSCSLRQEMEHSVYKKVMLRFQGKLYLNFIS